MTLTCTIKRAQSGSYRIHFRGVASRQQIHGTTLTIHPYLDTGPPWKTAHQVVTTVSRDDGSGRATDNAKREVRKYIAAQITLEALRTVARDHQAMTVDGYLVDANTAAMLVKVTDALGPDNQAKFLSLPLATMADMGWELVS